MSALLFHRCLCSGAARRRRGTADVRPAVPACAADQRPRRPSLSLIDGSSSGATQLVTSDDLFGGVLTWLKAISLVCLVCWVASWLLTGVKQGIVGRGRWFDYFGVAALVLTPVSVMIRVLESVKRLPVYSIASVPVSTLLFVTLVVLLLHLGRGGTCPDNPAIRPGTRYTRLSGDPSGAGSGTGRGFVPPADGLSVLSSCGSCRCPSGRN